jgi:CheY-like chemotaxis protein
MLENTRSAQAAQAQAREAQRMEIVGRLTGGVVHDFNNILTVITGTIEILAEAVADRPGLAAITELISDAAARGADLTSHLLAFARGQPSQARDVDINKLLVGAARLLRPTLGEQIEIETTSAVEVPPAWVDPSHLMTAILNLAVIARDAMPGGGKLVLESRSAAAGENGAGSALSAAHDVAIAVNVSGSGVDDRIFADLGLIEDLVGQSDGHIRVCRDAGRGASVEIYLPKAGSKANLAGSPAEESEKAGVEGGAEAILIVEDDVLVRKYVVTQVQSLGYRTLAAADASEALALLDAGEHVDLLLTDVIMPGAINGRQLAVEMLNRRPSLKVLFTSGYSENALVRDGYLDAGVLLLAKPYRKGDLARMIRIALAA